MRRSASRLWALAGLMVTVLLCLTIAPTRALAVSSEPDISEAQCAIVVDSAGTSTDELGRPMDRRTTATLRRHGVTDTGFAAKRARQFRADSFDDSDLVLAADHVHDEILRRRARDEDDVAKVRLLRSFDPVAAAAPDFDRLHVEQVPDAKLLDLVLD